MTFFTLSKRSNRRIPGTQKIFRYPNTHSLVANVSQYDQERVSVLAKTAPTESDPPSTPATSPASTKTYTIVNQPPVTAKRPQNVPPRVIPHKDLLNRTQDVQCYDAVPVGKPQDTRSDVEKFIPMLEEYLKRTPMSFPTTNMMNIYHLSPHLYLFSIRHSTNDLRPLSCERLRLGYFLPQDCKVCRLE